MKSETTPYKEQHRLINTYTSEVISGSVLELAQQLGCRVETIQALVLNYKPNNKYWGSTGFSGYAPYRP